ncbi:WecB/TagA/CpsF family glycosyltransferase [Xanthobacter sp. KR7-65]|uniref:WecB/TagA/CpsF family glycosyltransferase n=1 Tax=Xanthobacter sp. KR7-65 TaxID=3156612 RepID=UPI0032B4259C
MTTLISGSDRIAPAPFFVPAATRRISLRLFDIGLALLLVAITAPLMALLAFRSLATRGRVLRRERLLGKGGAMIHRHAFAARGPGRALPALFDILAGRLGFVGPRALAPARLPALPFVARGRFAVRPGLVSIRDVRQHAGLAYVVDDALDLEEIPRLGALYSIGLMLRLGAAALMGGTATASSGTRVTLFGVGVANMTMAEAVGWILRRASGSAPTNLCFVNADCFNHAAKDAHYRAVLNAADCVLPDGAGVAMAGKILGTPFAENVNGTDLFPRLCEALAGTGHSIFLLGAQPGVAETVARNMTERIRGLRIAGTRHGYFSPEEEDSVLDEINASGASILLVAMGAPRQEKWLSRHHHRLTPAVRMGVGGLFDFYSERVSRAPLWVREVRLEWVWRLIQEPRRMWRRYLLGNGVFLLRLARDVASMRLGVALRA